MMLCNNTNADIRDFDSVFFECIKTGATLPEELADIFTLRIIVVDGETRGIVEFA